MREHCSLKELVALLARFADASLDVTQVQNLYRYHGTDGFLRESA
jgi:hypothetical protein